MKGASLEDLVTEFTACVPATYRFDQMRPVGDELIEAMIKAFRSAAPANRSQAADLLSPAGGIALWSYARESAVRAVRERAPNRVMDGLLALAVQNGKPDIRDSILAMAMLFRSCQILNMDAASVFGEVSDLVPDDAVRSEMRGFPFRRKEDREIEAFFVFEKAKGDSFTYEQRAWDFRPAVRRAKVRRWLGRIFGGVQ